MMPFTNVDPDAIERRVIVSADLYKFGSLDMTTAEYTPPEKVKTLTADDIIEMSSVEEASTGATTEVRIKTKSTNDIDHDFAVVKMSARGYEETPTFYETYRMTRSNTTRSLTERTTETTYTENSETVNVFIESAMNAQRFGSVLESSYDETAGDFSVGSTKYYDFPHFMNIVAKVKGGFPHLHEIELSEAVQTYNETHKNASGIYYTNASMRSLLLDGGVEGILYHFNTVIRVSPRLSRKYRKNGNVLLYFANETPDEGRDFTKDEITTAEYENDAVYNMSYSVNFRGDPRLEIGDIVTVEDIGTVKIERIETKWDGTMTASMNATKVEA